MSEKRRDTKNRVLRTGESQRPDGTYMYRFSDFKKHRRTIYAKTLNELREKAAQAQAMQLERIDYEAGSISMAALVEGFVKRKRNIALGSRRGYQSIVNFINDDPFCQTPIKNIKMIYAKQWLQQIQEQGKSYNTVKRLYSVVKCAFKEAVEDDILRKNPFYFQLSSVLEQESSNKTALTLEEKTIFLELARTDRILSRYYLDIVILLGTGLRISELYGLTEHDIDFDSMTLSVNHQVIHPMTKNESFMIAPPKSASGVRIIPLREEVAEALRQVISARDFKNNNVQVDGHDRFLFVGNRGNPRSPATLQLAIKRTVDRYNEAHLEKLPAITPHTLRHTFCTEKIAKGADIKSVQYLMGHATPIMTLKEYTHPDMSAISRAMAL